MYHVFANRSKEDEIFPQTVKEIVEAQNADPILKHFFNRTAAIGAHERQLFDKLLW
jgi:hypothetical protein